MKKIFSAIFDGIGTLVLMVIYCVGAILAFIECLHTDGLLAVGYFILSLLSLGMFLLFAYCIGDGVNKGGAE